MMKIEDTIRAWKDPKFRDDSKAVEHPAGPNEVEDAILRGLAGGHGHTIFHGCMEPTTTVLNHSKRPLCP